MNSDTIKQINQINLNFYQLVADEFHGSRQYPWKGWGNLNPFIEETHSSFKRPLRVLDVGCGNARFAHFLITSFPENDLTYHGIDSSEELLQCAKDSLLGTTVDYTLQRLDIVDALLNACFSSQLENQYDLICLFGLIHHIPSLIFRKELISILTKHLHPGGKLIFTTWQFLDSEKLRKKIVSPHEVSLNPALLEKNDYILDWRRGEKAFRFCHYVDENELSSLIRHSNMLLQHSFQADAQEKNGNRYCILQFHS